MAVSNHTRLVGEGLNRLVREITRVPRGIWSVRASSIHAAKYPSAIVRRGCVLLGLTRPL
jgi:hypothetical protein